MCRIEFVHLISLKHHLNGGKQLKNVAHAAEMCITVGHGAIVATTFTGKNLILKSIVNILSAMALQKEHNKFYSNTSN